MTLERWTSFLLVVWVFVSLSTKVSAAPTPPEPRKKSTRPKVRASQTGTQDSTATTSNNNRGQKRGIPVWKIANKPLRWLRLWKQLHRQNPLLRRIRRQVAVLQTREQQTKAWPDVQLGVKGANIPIPTLSPTPLSMTGVQLSLSQRFPVTQRLKLKHRIATIATQMGKALLREQQVWQWFRLRSLLSRWETLRRSYHWQKQVHRWLGQVVQLARTRYTVQKATQQEMLRAMTAQVQVRNRLVVLRSSARMLEAELAQLLGLKNTYLPGSARWSLPTTLPSFRQQWTKARKDRGRLQRWRLLASQSKQWLKVAKTLYWSGMTLTVSYRQMFGSSANHDTFDIPHSAGMLSIGLKVAIPSGANPRRIGLAQEATARRLLAGARLKESLTKLKARLQIERLRWEQLRKQIQLSKTRLLPLAKQSYRATMQQYPVGKSGYSDVIRTLNTYVNEQIRLLTLQHRQRTTWFRLQALTGATPSKQGKKAP